MQLVCIDKPCFQTVDMAPFSDITDEQKLELTAVSLKSNAASSTMRL